MKPLKRDVNAFFHVIFSIPWLSLLTLWGLYFTAAIIVGYLPSYEHPDPKEVFGEGHFSFIPVLFALYLLSWIIPILFIVQCILQPFRWRSMVISFIGFLFNLFTMFYVGFWLFD